MLLDFRRDQYHDLNNLKQVTGIVFQRYTRAESIENFAEDWSKKSLPSGQTIPEIFSPWITEVREILTYPKPTLTNLVFSVIWSNPHEEQIQ